MGGRWEEDSVVLLLLIEQPLLIVTEVVGRPCCKLCALNGTKIGYYLRLNLIFADF